MLPQGGYDVGTAKNNDARILVDALGAISPCMR
jgi:hypothetical protein